MIKMMLQQKPKSRPSADKILTSALIQKKIEELHMEALRDSGSNQELMKTIRLPKKLHYLTDRLPKPNYEKSSDKGSASMKNSPSLQSKDKNLSKDSLPRLNQALLPGLNYIKGDRNRKKKVNGDILMIEGRSKIIEEARIHDRQGKNLEK
jgi:NIMA (never in mitosis gene a)-related kinase